MDIERETVVEAGISFAAVLLFVAVVFVVGMQFRTDGNISPTGGLAIVGSIVLFIVVMTAVGVWLAFQES